MIYTTKTCMVCKQASQIELDEEKLRQWKEGEPVQRVWPEKNSAERELIITGIHPACWERIFAEEEK